MRAWQLLAGLALVGCTVAPTFAQPRPRRRPAVRRSPPPSAAAAASTSAPGVDPVAFTGSFPARTGRFAAQLRVGTDAREVTLVVPPRRPPNPSLLVVFHGTSGDGAQILEEGAITPYALQQGFVVAAPHARYLPARDWDHPEGEINYWETFPNVDPDRNADLRLVRAVLVAAQRAYAIDPQRVYLLGHSSGAFFTLLAAMALRDRVAAFAENSGGLVRCDTTPACSFRGRGSACAALARQARWCACAGPEKPTSITATGRRPAAFLGHGTDDPVVSVYYTCALAEALTGAGYETSVHLRDGDGHSLPEHFVRDAWPFLAAHRLP